MSKKLIGLTGPSSFTAECIETVEKFYDADFVMLYHNNEQNIRNWVDRCDGVILAGGIDIHPSTYNQPVWNNQNLSKFDLKRDIRELHIVDRCRETKKPMLGICRGHQLIGVAYGFTLIPDISFSAVCHQPQRQQISLEKDEPIHPVTIVNPEEYFNVFSGRNPKERIAFERIMGHTQNVKLWTNSFHHQALFCPSKSNYPVGADEVKIYGTARIDLNSGKTKLDKIIELMGSDWWVSTQWHPEWDWEVNTASYAVLDRFKTLMNAKR